jgi:hypothetical protein
MAEMKKPTGKVKLTPAQVAAAEKKALEAYRKSRPSKEQVMKIRERQAAKAAADQKVVDRINAQTRTNRSKTTVSKPAPASMLKKATETVKQKPKVKITGTATSKPRVSNSMIKSQPATASKPKAKPLTGPAAVAEIQRRTSPAGVKKAEMDAKKATKKKYPGLYNK